MKKLIFTSILCTFFTLFITAQDAADDKINKLIRKHGMEQSKVMEAAF